jgi:hypothetical protein
MPVEKFENHYDKDDKLSWITRFKNFVDKFVFKRKIDDIYTPIELKKELQNLSIHRSN